MALISCPECNKQISDKAKICVGCGAPVEVNPNPLIGIPIKFGNLEVAQYEFPNKMNWDDAKKACEALGYGWRLPNQDELKTLYNRVGAIGGFAHDDYWSSTEDGNVGAWVHSFNSGVQYRSKKFTYQYYVRAVRNF